MNFFLILQGNLPFKIVKNITENKKFILHSSNCDNIVAVYATLLNSIISIVY